MWLLLWIIIDLSHILDTEGHGRLLEPPSRASMWRSGYDTPHNYLDNQLFCGGFTNQWQIHGGKCGVCGDPWQGPREHEAGGKYANGIITRQYSVSSVILVVVEITAPHRGWFEFRICPNNDFYRAATWDCLNRRVLPLADGSGTRYYVTPTYPMKHEILLELPKGLECSQCVIQWMYNAGNSWGVEADGRACVGCGNQEQFYGCADVAIGQRPPLPTYHRPPMPSPRTTPGDVMQAIDVWQVPLRYSTAADDGDQPVYHRPSTTPPRVVVAWESWRTTTAYNGSAATEYIESKAAIANNDLALSAVLIVAFAVL